MTGIYKGSLNKHLSRFSKKIGETFYHDASIKVPENWMDELEKLKYLKKYREQINKYF